VLRAYPGKQTAEVHDYHDVETPVLAAALAKRAPGYVSLGFADPRAQRVITAETWIAQSDRPLPLRHTLSWYWPAPFMTSKRPTPGDPARPRPLSFALVGGRSCVEHYEQA
jgi:hypothetical protein